MTAAIVLTLMFGYSEHPAENWFRDGVAQRRDATAARESFRKSAGLIEGTTVSAAHAKARALALSGNTPEAIRYLLRGLKLSPSDREIQADLRALRETIRYPEPADPLLRVRPDGFDAFRFRISPAELFLFAGVSGLAGVAGFLRHRTARSTASLALVSAGVVGFLSAFALSRWIAVDTPIPLVLANPTTLRVGNGTSYPARLSEPLPAGAELKELTRRGGWVQVELPGGAAGWLPEELLLE